MESKGRRMTIVIRQTKDVDLSSLEDVLNAIKSAETIDDSGKEYLIWFAKTILKKLNPTKEPQDNPKISKKVTNGTEKEQDKKDIGPTIKANKQDPEDFEAIYQKGMRLDEPKMDELYAKYGLKDPLNFNELPEEFKDDVRELIRHVRS